MPETMEQYAPYPQELQELVDECTYRPGWGVWLSDQLRDPADTHGHAAGGLTLVIKTVGYDTYHPEYGQNYRVNHFFVVPAATYNRQSWLRWLFDCFHKVEFHECMEFFTVGGEKPFAPTHGPGDDPYVIHEIATDLQRKTNYRGQVKE